MMLNRRLIGSAKWGLLCGAIVVIACSTARPAHALSQYLAAFRTQYPAAAGTRIDGCGLCHSAVPQRNSYGSAFQNAGFAFVPIEGLDSDGDGATNLAEIVALTFPGDAADVPALPSPTPTATPPLATPTATPPAGSCTGDCNANGAVTVDELLKAVNIALGIVSVDACSAADRNDDGVVSINELLIAVNAGLIGCPSS